SRVLLLRIVQQGIRNHEAFDGAAADDVRFYDFIHVCQFHVAVPYRFWIHHYCWAQLALIEAARFVRPDCATDSALGQLRFKYAMQFTLARRIAAAAWIAIGPLIRADEDMSFELRH